MSSPLRPPAHNSPYPQQGGYQPSSGSSQPPCAPGYSGEDSVAPRVTAKSANTVQVRLPNSAATQRFLDTSHGQWEAISLYAHEGVGLYKRPSGLKLPEYRADGLVNAPLDVVLAALMDYDDTKWMGADVCQPMGDYRNAQGQLVRCTRAYADAPLLGPRVTFTETTTVVHPESHQAELLMSMGRDDGSWRDAKRVKYVSADTLLTAVGNQTFVQYRVTSDPNISGLGLAKVFFGSKVEQVACERAKNLVTGLRTQVTKLDANSRAVRLAHQALDQDGLARV